MTPTRAARLRRRIRTGVLVVPALALLLALLALLIPRHWQVERAVQIRARPEQVYPLVAELRQWPQWAVWQARSAQREARYEGPSSGVGAVSEWHDRGRRRLTVIAAEPDRSLDYELTGDGVQPTRGRIVLVAEPGGTRVSWTVEGDSGFNPWRRYFGFVAARRSGDDVEHGLARLKRRSEDLATAP